MIAISCTWKFETIAIFQFWREGNKNLSEQGREPTTNFNPHMASSSELTPGPHWREASALTIASSFSPKGNKAIRGVPYLTPPHTPFSFHRDQYATVTALFHSASCSVLVKPVSWFSINSTIFFVIKLKQNYWSLTFLCVDETLWCYYW